MKILYVEPDYVGLTWPLIKDYVKGVIDITGGRRSMASTLDEMVRNQVSLWVAQDGAGEIKGFITSRLVDYPDMRMLGVELVGGEDVSEWEHETMEAMIDFAKANGCSGLEGYGRGDAWARRLRQYGWTKVFTTVEMRWDRDE